MKSIDKPSHIFWFVTLPQALLAAGLVALLAQRAHTGALWMLIISAAVNIAFTVYAVVRRKQTAADKPAMVALAAACCALLAASVLLLDDALLFGFLSLRLAALLLSLVSAVYAVLALAKTLPAGADAGRYLLGLAALPLGWFLAFNIFSGIRLQTVAMILVVAGAFAAVFLLIRIISLKGAQVLASSGSQKRKWTVLYAIFSIALPLIGLLLNLSLDNFLGDFSDPAFFIIPVVNGVLLLLPPFADKRLRLLRFFLLSAALVYFIYFFTVFVPFMPIGFIGLIYVVGVLLFAPAGALAMQIIEIIREWRRLLPLWGGGRMLAVFIPALLLIPACMLTSYIGDRQNFVNASTYLETSGSPSGETINLVRLDRALKNSEGTFEIDRDIFSDFTVTTNTPLLSGVYSALVLDKKVMRDGDVDRLRRLFFDEYDNTEQALSDGLTVNEQSPTSVRLADVQTETEYDPETGVSRTWVNLTLQSPSGSFSDEYVTLFTLPEGAYVSDYYLDVGTTRKYGILADERAAMSTYESIVRVRQDPGVLHYVGDRQLELRVFPFGNRETRRTGFEIIHSQSLELDIDGQTISLEAASTPDEVSFDGGVLVSPALKATLPKAGRDSLAYYFVVDSSAHSNIGYQLSLIEDYTSMSGIADAKVIFASYNLKETTLAEARTVRVTPQCGFNLALAVRQALSESGGDAVPVILFTSGNPAGALMPEHSSWLAKQYPESPYFYRLRDDLKLIPYEFGSSEQQDAVDAPVIMPLRLYHDTYVRDDGQSEIISSDEAAMFQSSGSQYADALALDIALRRNPSMDKAMSLKLLRAAFRAHVLTQQTSFIVVETTQQEAELLEAQERLLEQDSASARETLDEPPLLPMAASAAGLACVLLFIRRKRKKIASR